MFAEKWGKEEGQFDVLRDYFHGFAGEVSLFVSAFPVFSMFFKVASIFLWTSPPLASSVDLGFSSLGFGFGSFSFCGFFRDCLGYT
jgi:hypothetical protein